MPARLEESNLRSFRNKRPQILINASALLSRQVARSRLRGAKFTPMCLEGVCGGGGDQRPQKGPLNMRTGFNK